MNSFSCYRFCYLFVVGFIAAYLYSFVLIIFALISEVLFEMYIISLFSSYTESEILGLSISNSLRVLCLKLYLFKWF